MWSGGGAGLGGVEERENQEIDKDQTPETILDSELESRFDSVSGLGEERLSFQLFILKLPNLQRS